MNEVREEAWLGVHLFLTSDVTGLYGMEGDRALVEVVMPFVSACEAEGWIERFFFIRYPDGGSHLRVRFSGRQSVLEREVQPALSAHLSASCSGLCIDGRVRLSASTGSLVRAALYVPYVPEVERYGGHKAMSIAEDFFESSSLFAARVLMANKQSARGHRLGQALVAMLALATGQISERASGGRFFKQYSLNMSRIIKTEGGWPPGLEEQFRSAVAKQAATLSAIIPDIWTSLGNGDECGITIDEFVTSIKCANEALQMLEAAGELSVNAQARTSAEVRSGIMASQIHMTNNRLGITPVEEGYLAYLCATALSEGSAE